MFSRKIYGFLRSSHRRYFMKKAGLKNFTMFTRMLQACNFIKNRLQHKCFPLNITKFLRAPISKGCLCSSTFGPRPPSRRPSALKILQEQIYEQSIRLYLFKIKTLYLYSRYSKSYLERST